MKVITQVSAIVDAAAESALVEGFQRLMGGAKPDGLEQTSLLRGPGGLWLIETVWRDREALDRMRAGAEPPAAPQLFLEVGAKPTLQILSVEAATHA